jgi:hypothetical protein
MNRPDSNPSDPSANQDDAVWLDLVARLEGKTPEADTEPKAGDARQDPAEHPPAPAASSAAGTSDSSSTDPAAVPETPAKRFTDFDPLGLAPSAAAPVELSAVEREQAAARQRAAEAGGSGATRGDGDQFGPEGPRDYGVDDEDGAFVPEDPPILSATDPLTMLAWIGAVGSPIALVLSAMFWRSAPLLAILGMVAVFVAAVVYLIMKLPQEKDENDDGARV